MTIFEELTKVCGRNGYSWEIQYSEAENTYYGYILDFGKIKHEIKRISRLEDLVGYMLARMPLGSPEEAKEVEV